MNKNNLKIKFFWILAVLANIKSAFSDFGTDQAYAVATSFRHISGDRLFQEMCEPHQTSSFITDLLMLLYRCFVPSMEGIALYLQVCGVLLYAIVVYVLYKELLHYAEKEMAHYMCIFFFVFRAKQSVFPEFSNMQIGFSVLLFVLLLKFYRNQKKTILLIWAAIFLCLQVLAYPTCIIVFVGVLLVIYIFSEKKRKNILVFAGVCALCGAIYLLFFCSNLGMETFKETIMFLMQSDTSHAKVDFDIIDYFRSFIYGASWIALVAAFSYIAAVIRKKKESFITYFGVGILLTEIVAIVLVGVVDIDWNCQYFVILLLLIGMGIKNHKAITQNVKALYYTGLIISVLSAISVMFLTNLDFLSVLGYLILGAMVSFIAINIGEKNRKESSCRICSFIILITVTFLYHRGIIVCGYANEDGINLVCDLENIVRVGPTKGIVASLQKCNEVRGTLTDWETYVKDEEVLVVVPWMLDSAIYVDSDAKISTYSTINTPTYNESLLEYWTKYPDKTPGIIAVEAWNGEISVRKNTWIMKWVEENYSTYDNGVFWRFYKKE